ncbi:ATP/GTP-binding protein [Streptomyces sp. NPDC057621]|uniref:ATP/GTP-binding protein n=1 Tax=Streptomyces sp. NPDC057621 TaxID=3346186 RepID=UPI0036A9F2C1
MEDPQRNAAAAGVRHWLIRAAALLGSAGLFAVGVPAPPVFAAPPDGGGVCRKHTDTWVSVCANDATQHAGSSAASSQPGHTRASKAVPPPCSVQRLVPQPPTNSVLWQGHQPGDGGVYTRICPVAASGSQAVGGLSMAAFDTFWAAAAPAPAMDPRVLAQQAVDKMLLQGPDIDISPRPGGTGLVGMPVWMAVDESQTTWGPNTASASAGRVTVTATAKVARVVWAMGDGSSVTCTGPGTVYRTSYGLKASPDCGHVYTRPSADTSGGTYTVTATSTWVIDWQGGGASGQLTEIRTSSVTVAIVESQAVNS